MIDLSYNEISKVKIDTQVRNENTIQDIQIETPRHLLFIEVKVGSPLTDNQVLTYIQLLRKSKHYPNARLISLTKYPVGQQTEKDIYSVRWYEVAEWLESYFDNLSSDISKFLVDQFLFFLKSQNSTIPQVKTNLSHGIKRYEQKMGNQSIFRKRLRRLDVLSKDDDLKPLHDFLLLLDEVFKKLGFQPEPHFDSGQSKEGKWIGYNINKMTYFVFITLNEPEVLCFQTFNRIILEPTKELGVGVLYKEHKRITWWNRIDLALTKFFDQTKENQLKLILNFVKTSIEFAESISQPGHKKS